MPREVMGSCDYRGAPSAAECQVLELIDYLDRRGMLELSGGGSAPR